MLYAQRNLLLKINLDHGVRFKNPLVVDVVPKWTSCYDFQSQIVIFTSICVIYLQQQDPAIRNSWANST